MRRPLLGCLLVLLVASCAADSDQADSQRDWLHVLHRKKAAAASTASTRQKQVYADTLGAFVQKHPTHSRARAVYQRIQLDFAEELSSIGRYQDAIRFYRAVLAYDATNAEAKRGLAFAADRLVVSRQKLLDLEKGMSQKQVAQLLGKPIPGWTVRTDRRDATMDSWYYRTTEGGIAGVYFRDGVLIAAEAASHEKISPLSR
jgi:hypothetical protein